MKTILVVDDNTCIREVLRDVLTPALPGFTIRTAKDGAEAKQIFDSSPDMAAVITDLSMPVMNGYELMEYIRTRSGRIPLVTMTTSVGPDAESRFNELGVAYWFEKPFDIFKIAGRISSIVEKSEVAARSEVLESGAAVFA